MADFYPPQFQNPDFLGQYLRGQQGAQQAQAFPGLMQRQQQEIAGGDIDLQQKQLALQNMKMYQALVQRTLGTQSTQTGQQPGEPTGGIQNGPQGSVSQPQSPTSGSGLGGIGIDPGTMQAMEMLRPGGDPVKAAIDVRNYQKTQAQLQAQGPMNLADSVASSPNADTIIRNNPSLAQQWVQLAPRLGLDPFKDLTPANARAVARFGYNNLAGQVGLPPKEMPDQLVNQNLGSGEIGQFSSVTGKKVGDVTERQNPTYTLVDRYDPKTNSTVKVPVQTGGFGMGGINPATGASAGSAGSGGPSGFNEGMKAPSDPQLKAAMFGSEMRSGMNTLNKLESSGFELSPKTRALVINTATSEDEGMIKQLVSQEALKHGMTPQEQTYVAALMPMLQAAGHDQSGARLTTSQVRQNVESLLPIDVNNREALDQVRQNRQGFYTGLLTQAGAAAQLPQYKNTLGSDLKNAQQPSQGSVAPFNDAAKEARYQAWKAQHK